MVLILFKETYGYVGRIDEFPSPCGDYGSYQDVAEDVTDIVNDCFRPLAGIMVLISYGFQG